MLEVMLIDVVDKDGRTVQTIEFPNRVAQFIARYNDEHADDGLTAILAPVQPESQGLRTFESKVE